LETGRDVTSLDFPADEGTAAGGYDGVAVTAAYAPYVPAGQSLWELSAGQSTNAKATTDYEKRTVTPDGRPTSKATYIAVSLRRWRDRRKWATERQEDTRWREVRAYGIDDLETWLESAPVTHAWISERLGLKPHGLQTADAWWTSWSDATDPVLSGDVILAGRDEAASSLRAKLDGPPQIISMRGDSVDDVLAFVAAVALRDDANGAGEVLARTAFVDDVGTWRTFNDHKRPLVLVTKSPAVMEEARSAPGHHVIVPLSGQLDADIELAPIDASAAKDALVAAGLDDEPRADETARLGRRSLTALRRHLAKKPELHTPPWATGAVDRPTRGILLAGSWNDASPGDQEVLAELVGLPYEDLRERLSAEAEADDPLVTRVGNTWTVVSPYDAWVQLRRKLRPDDMARLRAVVEQVLVEADPTFGMEPQERWKAPKEGQVWRHSGDLRNGLASTIALLGAHGEKVNAGHGATGVTVADGMVRRLLRRADEDATGAVWSALSPQLPLLAEGAPDAFLDEARTGATGANSVLLKVFEQESDPMFARSPHTGLLWALESLAWSPDHFGQAVSLLARLAELDPGGQLSNRPDRSLAGIYCPWHPETTSNNDQRLATLDGIRDRHPQVAWELMVSLLPESHGVHFPTSSPRFRDWKPSDPIVTNLQYFEFVESLIDRLIQDAADVPERWQKLVDESNHVSPSSRAKIREELRSRIEAGSLREEGREALWDELRKLIARHREFADTDWALPEDELAELEEIEQQLAPSGLVERHAWLFEEWMPNLGESKLKDGEYDHRGYTTELQKRRDDAVREIEAEAGWEGLMRLAKRSPSPWWVGCSLAELENDSYEAICLPLIDSDDSVEYQVANALFGRRFVKLGWDWLESLLADGELRTMQTARLLLLTDDLPRSWQRADEFGPDVATGYWRGFGPTGLGRDYPHVSESATRMLDVGRPGAALQLLSLYAGDEEASSAEHAGIAADALDALLKVQDPVPEIQVLRQYDLERMFSLVEEHRDALGADRVARLEWSYLGALGHDPTVPSLHQALADDPMFFVQVISTIYRAKGDEPTEVSDEQSNIAENAYRLLSSWSTLPGRTSDGGVDPASLRAWVHAALEQLDAARRRAVGEINIGHVLASAPPDPDGTWPCRTVRDLLEELQSETIEQGLETQLFNNRGVTSRHPEAGGEQERTLANKYRGWAGQVRDRWPRSAAILRSLASTYEQDARRMDDEAERRRKGIG
jgi:hypothetical protein